MGKIGNFTILRGRHVTLNAGSFKHQTLNFNHYDMKTTKE